MYYAMHVVVPAYRPTLALVNLVAAVLRQRPLAHVVVVDDGSGPHHAPIFDAVRTAGATLLRLESNHGKGHALKVAFAHLIEMGAVGTVVTADADGQHSVDDIFRVADAVDTHREAPVHLVLGERALDVGTPARSRLGNTVTRWLFRMGTGHSLRDTQTGLRAFPSALLPWLATPRGERYEYELAMLLEAVDSGIPIRSVRIETIYEEGNATSHFRPLVDSARIYLPLLTFMASSLSAFVVDVAALLILDSLLGALLASVVLARIMSASTNFAVNRNWVFRRPDPARMRSAAWRYATLAGALLTANYLILRGLTSTGLDLLPAKLLTEALLVTISYTVQARYVFRGSPPDTEVPTALSMSR